MSASKHISVGHSVLKRDGSVQPFDKNKLVNSIQKAGATPKQAALVSDRVANRLGGSKQAVPSSQLSTMVARSLGQVNPQASSQYTAYRNQKMHSPIARTIEVATVAAATVVPTETPTAWTAKPDLSPSPVGERSYSVETDEGGTNSVTFGDGKDGDRLPSGASGVDVTYKRSLGEHAGEYGALLDLLGVIEQEAKELHEDIENLYDNWFTEKPDDWCVPYIGGFIGTILEYIEQSKTDINQRIMPFLKRKEEAHKSDDT